MRVLNKAEDYYVRRFATMQGARGIAEALACTVQQAQRAINGQPLGSAEPEPPKENREFLDRYRGCVHRVN
jgi:hypothetical protein